MFQRLTLARDLLAEDGAALVHIDDNEVFNLGLLPNKVSILIKQVEPVFPP